MLYLSFCNDKFFVIPAKIFCHFLAPFGVGIGDEYLSKFAFGKQFNQLFDPFIIQFVEQVVELEHWG